MNASKNITSLKFLRTRFGVAFLMLFLYGCPPCDPIEIDNGPIPDSILALVPYNHGGIYRLRHSNGKTISFAAQRYSECQIMECRYCCDRTNRFEINTTSLTPDYPVFNISLRLSNADTAQYEFSCSVGKFFLNIPVHKSQYSVFYDFTDSLLIGEIYYHNVFRIKPYDNNLWNEPIKVDSVFYNQTEGILLIKMSNDEYYRIVD